MTISCATRNCIVLLVLLVASSAGFAQPGAMSTPVIDTRSLLSRSTLGLNLNYLRSTNKTDAQILIGCPECGNFNSGTSAGAGVRLFTDIPAFTNWFQIEAGVGYEHQGGSFGETATAELPILDPNTNKYVPLRRTHTFDAGLSFISILLTGRVHPLRLIPFFFSGGLSSHLPLSKATTFTQSESIVSPNGVLYPQNNARSIVDGSGSIKGLETNFGLTATASYEWPLSAVLTAAPEISYTFPLTAIVSTYNWKVSTLGFGVSIRYQPPIPEPPVLVHIPMVSYDSLAALRRKLATPKPPAFAATLPEVKILETIVTETFPILPYIFFDSASAALPQRFQDQTVDPATFQENNLPHTSLTAYYNLLNVVGKRMRENPTATLIINGTSGGREISSVEAKGLSRQRAKNVKNYLAEHWLIPAAQMKISTSEKPEHPSSTEYAEGYEENRRVELSSDDPNLLKPIVHERFREHTLRDRTLDVKLRAADGLKANTWKIALASKDSIILNANGNGKLPQNYSWNISDLQAESIADRLAKHEDISLETTAMDGQKEVAKLKTPLASSTEINPFELSRLSLIVFDFDNSDINEQNKTMISQFVAKSMLDQSTSNITGSTDHLGELKHNQELSEARAFHVRDLILASKPDAKILSTRGIGPSQLRYDNALPEGRYYCRTVTIEVETPLSAIRP